MAAGVVLVDRLEGPLYLNAAASRLLGQTLESLHDAWRTAASGSDWTEALGTPVDGREHPVRHAIRTGKAARVAGLHVRMPRGSLRTCDVAVEVVGGMVVVTLADVSTFASSERWSREVELKAAQLEATIGRREARTDPLTGLLNRRGFEEVEERVRARSERSRLPYGVVLLDLDGFKAVNDRLGHEVGDEVLCAVAALLHTHTRVTDKLVRLGGDEFVVLLPDTDATTTAHIAERLRQQVHVEVGGLTVTASVGEAVGGEIEGDPIATADARMYAHKAVRRQAT